MRYVATPKEMAELDRTTIEEIGLPGAVLMENAGRAAARAVVEELERARGTAVGARIAVVCGSGNNGGDGYVVARCLREQGLAATVYLAADRAKIGGDARLHLDVYEQVGGLAVSVDNPGALAGHRDGIVCADCLVDCVFGTGLSRDVEGHYRSVLEVMRYNGGCRVAVDVPSGLSAETGQVMGLCVDADRTVTMGCLKVGLVAAPGFAHCGAITVADIGIPAQLAQARGVRAGVVEHYDVETLLPPLAVTDHKNRRGHLLVAAGSPGKRGAARMTAWAALRAGSGLVTVATADADRLCARAEIMTAELDADAEDAAPQLLELCAGKAALAMGPGMSTGAGGQRLVRAALAEAELPLVLDADALNHVGADLGRVAGARAPVILTPHPGEAARLLDTSPTEIEADRITAARRLAEASRAIVVLKGARTLVCDGMAGEGFVTVNPTGGPALATAGAGDVLTGVVAGLVAQGMPPEAAARAGVYLHGLAGDIAAEALGPRSVVAGDVTEHLPAAYATLEPPGTDTPTARETGR